nr:hypothetical protein [Segetibacter sp.]
MMFDSNNKFSKVPWIAGGVLLLVFIGFIYSSFFKQSSTPNFTGLLLIGLILGATIMFLISKLTSVGRQRIVKEDSHTVVESMRKVFKIVFAEGHF